MILQALITYFIIGLLLLALMWGNSKQIKKYDKPIYKGKYPEMYRYYDLAGCRVTTNGKNVCRG